MEPDNHQETDADRLERSVKAMLSYTSKIKVLPDCTAKHFTENCEDDSVSFLSPDIMLPDEEKRNEDFFASMAEIFPPDRYMDIVLENQTTRSNPSH